jgi:2-methylisocitrate lyase-like PEP mutase family enzyme
MTGQRERAQHLTALHVPGDPLIIYNVWDAGSAKAVAAAGAKALATGDHPVGFAHGFGLDDFGDFTFDIYLGTIREIAARAGELPFSVDISNGEGLDLTGLKERVRVLLDLGIAGVNFEDRLEDSSGVRPAQEQAERIAAIVQEGASAGVPLHVNARTDLFSTAGDMPHADLVGEAVGRAAAYRDAGARSLFTPRLLDLGLIRQLCRESVLPVNIIRLPGAPSTRELAGAGVARVSYGPMVQRRTMAWVTEQARLALTGEI